MSAPRLRDARFTLSCEWCGHPKRRHVLRFCGEWVSSHPTRAEGRKARREAIAARVASLSAGKGGKAAA